MMNSYTSNSVGKKSKFLCQGPNLQITDYQTRFSTAELQEKLDSLNSLLCIITYKCLYHLSKAIAWGGAWGPVPHPPPPPRDIAPRTQNIHSCKIKSIKSLWSPPPVSKGLLQLCLSYAVVLNVHPLNFSFKLILLNLMIMHVHYLNYIVM